MKDTIQQAIDKESVHYQAIIEVELERVVRMLAQGLLDKPASMPVTFHWERGAVAVSVKPADQDGAKMIGGKGRMYHSFKTVLVHWAHTRKLWLTYHIINDEQRRPAHEITFTANEKWPAKECDRMFAGQCEAVFGPGLDLRRVDEKRKPKTRYFLTLPHDALDWPEDLKWSLSYIWHASAYRLGRMVYLESIERRAS